MIEPIRPDEPLENEDPYGYVRSARAVARTATAGYGWRRRVAWGVAMVVLIAFGVGLVSTIVGLLSR